MLKAVSYASVSSVEQRERGFFIEVRIRFIRKYAGDHDQRIVRIVRILKMFVFRGFLLTNRSN